MSTSIEPRARQIVVIGGVAAGMSAAARARRLDDSAHIVILERGPHVSFANCGLPYYVGGEIERQEDLLIQTPRKLHAALGLDVRANHEVTAIDPEARTVTVCAGDQEVALTYDALVLAPGAVAVRPALPGLDSPRVTTLRTVDDASRMRAAIQNDSPARPRRAVVLGGGFIGVEAAEALRHRGLEVHLVELAAHVLPPLEAEVAAPVTEELRRLGITVHAGVAATAIAHASSHDTVELADGTRLAADLILLSVGVRPDTAIFEAAGVECERGWIVVDEHGRTNLPDVYAAGDATLAVDAVTRARRAVALAGPANRAGRAIADHIMRPESARGIPSPVGTAIVRVGEITAALTGASRASLECAGIEAHTLHLHPTQHAGYFPGAVPMGLVVHIRRGDGLILGAQAVGRDGVDKRIDVIATAIRAGMTAADLIDLDLAYSPVYGSAKDPVNLAGMIGTNVIDGTLALWYSHEWGRLRDEALILDVRSPEEYAGGHLPGSLNVPHTELRGRLDEVREVAAGRPIRVLCGSGVRSHIAHRLLSQSGFDSASLSGGMLTARALLGEDVLTKS